jgi:chromosome segregation ATPase
MTTSSKPQQQPSDEKKARHLDQGGGGIVGSDDVELSQRSNNSTSSIHNKAISGKKTRRSLLERLHLSSSRRNAQSQPPPVTRKTTNSNNNKKSKNATSSFSNKPIVVAAAAGTVAKATPTTNVAAVPSGANGTTTTAAAAAAVNPAIVSPTSSSSTTTTTAPVATTTEELNTSTTTTSSNNTSRRGRSFSRRRSQKQKKEAKQQQQQRRRRAGSVSSSTTAARTTEAAPRSTSRSRSWFRRSLSNQRSRNKEKVQQPQEPVVPQVVPSPAAAADDAADHEKIVPMPTVSSLSLQRSTETLVRSLIHSPTEHVTEQSVQRALKEWNRMQQELANLRTTTATTADHSGVGGSAAASAAAAAAANNKLPLILLETKNRQLQLELVAAQKAAAQLQELNQEREEEQVQARSELAAMQAQVVVQLQESKTRQVQWQKQVEQLQLEKTKLEQQCSSNNNHGRGRMPTRRPIPAGSPGGGGDGHNTSIHTNNNPMEESFEIQLSMQKNVAHLTAKVQQLAAESANFQREWKMKCQQYEQLQDAHQLLLLLLEQQRQQQTQTQMQQTVDQPSVVSSTGVVSVGSVGDNSMDDIVDRSPKQEPHHHRKQRDEEEWRSLLKKMQQKNQNQKKVFETAMEIKDVELQIYQKERDLAVEKTHALQQKVAVLEPQVADLHQQLLEEQQERQQQAQYKDDESSSSAVLAATAAAQEAAERWNMRIQDLEQDLIEGDKRIAMLQSELEEKEQLLEFQSNETLEILTEERARLDEVTADLFAKEMEMQELKEQQEQYNRLKQSVDELERQLGEYQENAQLHEVQIQELQRELESQRRLSDKASRRVQKEAAKMVESQSQLAEEAFKTCKEESDQKIASLQQRVAVLEAELAHAKDQQQELEDLLQMAHDDVQEQLRLAEEQRAKILLEQKVETDQEDKRLLRQLREQLDESERKLEQALRDNGMASASQQQSTDPPNHQGSSRLAELRKKMGTYEHLMRAKVKRIHEMETHESRSASPNTACSSVAQDDLASFPLVVATLLPNMTSPPGAAAEAARLRELQESVRARDETIAQLQTELQEAQERLVDTATQQVFMAHNNADDGTGDDEELHDDCQVDMENALHDASADRVAQLKAELVQAQQRLVHVQQHVQVQATEDRERQVDEIRQESNERLAQMQDQLFLAQSNMEDVRTKAVQVEEAQRLEMEQSLQASNDRILQLQEQLAQSQLLLKTAEDRASKEAELQQKEVSEARKADDERIRQLQEQLDHKSATGDASNHRETEISDERIVMLKEQLAAAQARLSQVTNSEPPSDELLGGDEFLVEKVSSETQDQLSALQIELEQECSRHRETQHAYEMLARQVEVLEEERENTVGQLQEAEVELLGLQLKYEEMESALASAASQVKEANALMAQSDSSTGNEHLAELENKLKRKNALLRKADKKIEILEQFIQQEKQVLANDHQGEIERLEALVKEKEGEANAVRAEMEELRAQIDSMRNRVEQLEEERNHNRAKLSELSGILQVRGKNQVEFQLYNKCIECADLTADKDSLQHKLRAAQATAQRLEQEVSMTRELVQNMSQSWDGAMSSDESVVRLKREQEQSLTKAMELSIQLAESQMQIDDIRERLNNAERANRSYAEQLARGTQGRGNFQDRIVELIHGDTTVTSGGNCTSDNNNNDEAMRRMKQRIELLEDENAAYVASLSAVKSELEMRQEGSS